MKSTVIAIAFLAIAAANGYATTSPAEATLGAVPLSVVKRLHQLPTPPQTRTDVKLTGIPMRTATLPAAATLSGRDAAATSPVQVSGIPMALATRPPAALQPGRIQEGAPGCESMHATMGANVEHRC